MRNGQPSAASQRRTPSPTASARQSVLTGQQMYSPNGNPAHQHRSDGVHHAASDTVGQKHPSSDAVIQHRRRNLHCLHRSQRHWDRNPGRAAPVSAGRSFMKTLWRPPGLDGYDDDSASPFPISATLYAAQFSAPVAGQRVFVRSRHFSATAGSSVHGSRLQS